MSNLKFFNLMRSLDEKESQAFHKYLKQMHGGEEIALKVFAYFKRFAPTFQEEKKLEISYAYQKIFDADLSAHPSNRIKILNALSDLHGWLKDFLLAQKIRSDSPEVQMLWLSILQERGLKNESSKLSARLYEPLPESLVSNMHECQRQIAIGLQYHQEFFQSSPKTDYAALNHCSAFIKERADILSLMMESTMLNIQQMLLAHSPQKAKSRPVQPLQLLYKNILTLVKEDSEASFYQIEALLETHADALGSNEIMTILRYLHNFVGKRFRLGQEQEWGIHSHQLNKIRLKKGLIAVKGEITPNNFSNIVNIAAKAKDFDWARSFIQEHKHYLHENFRDESVLMAYAIIAFEEKEYQKVIESLENKMPKLLANTVRSISLLMRAYYELDPDDGQIMEHCLGFESYLQRHRSPKMDYTEAVISFLRLFKMLLTGKLSKDQLLRKIETNPNLYHRSWLREKAQEYKKR